VCLCQLCVFHSGVSLCDSQCLFLRLPVCLSLNACVSVSLCVCLSVVCLFLVSVCVSQCVCTALVPPTVNTCQLISIVSRIHLLISNVEACQGTFFRILLKMLNLISLGVDSFVVVVVTYT